MGFNGNKHGKFHEVAKYIYLEFKDGVFTFNDLARVIPNSVLKGFKFGYGSMVAMSNKGLIMKVGKESSVWKWKLTQSAVRSILMSL